MKFSTIAELTDLINELFTVELIFTDMKLKKVYNCNYEDELFMKPNLKRRDILLNKLKRICNYNVNCFNRIHRRIVEESYNCVRDNSENLEGLINYSIDLVLENNCK